MKYLKNFNESKSDFLDDLKGFCDEYLAFLIDNGFIVKTYSEPFVTRGGRSKNYKYYCIEIVKGWWDGRFISVNDFTWDEIKDDFIPFFEMLSNKYNIEDCKLRGDFKTLNSEEITIHNDDILDDGINNILTNKKEYISMSRELASYDRGSLYSQIKNKKIENLLPKIHSIKIIIKK